MLYIHIPIADELEKAGLPMGPRDSNYATLDGWALSVLHCFWPYWENGDFLNSAGRIMWRELRRFMGERHLVARVQLGEDVHDVLDDWHRPDDSKRVPAELKEHWQKFGLLARRGGGR